MATPIYVRTKELVVSDAKKHYPVWKMPYPP